MELVAVLFAALPSEVVEVMLAEAEMVVPSVTPALTTTFTTIVAVPAFARFEPSVQVMDPVAPTPGFVHVHPAAAVTDWNVVLAGVACVNTGAVAAPGPLFVTTLV